MFTNFRSFAFRSSDVSKIKRNFLLSLGGLVLFGIVMVYSSSYMYAKDEFGTSSFFLLRHLAFVCFGILVCLVVSISRIKFWFSKIHYLLMVNATMVVLTFIPGIGHQTKGACRWLKIGGFTFQPGELSKILIPLVFFKLSSNYLIMERKEKLSHLIPCLVILISLALQPDYGTFFICTVGIIYSGFLAKLSVKKFLAASFTACLFLFGMVFAEPYRVKRLLSYLDPWKNAKTTGFQVIQSFLAFANGGILGVGLGNSSEKLFYLPEAYNDFILSVVGEETGFWGVSFLILAFIFFLLNGFSLALNAESEDRKSLISIMVFVLGLQVTINFGVVLGLLPTKGLNLPFISYGGSSMVSNFIAIGLILSSMRTSSILKRERF